MKEIIINLLSKEVKLEKKEILKLIEIPPSSDLGDYSFPCFILAKQLKKNPSEIASELSKKLKTSKDIEKIIATGPYLNFFINKKSFGEITIKEILKERKKEKKKGKTLVEFLGPNTNKPLHLGHLRNMSIGESVSRILEFSGDNVKKVNLYNDRGIHITKSMLAYKKFGKSKKPNKKPDHFVGDFYILYGKELEKNPEMENENKDLLKKWEEEDKETLAIWKKMNKWVIKGIKETYKKFGIKFDKEYYESKIYKKAKEIIQDGIKKGLFKKRKDNAVIINLGKELGEKVLLRADNTSVYITQDMYLAKLRYQDYKFDRLIYIVGNEQDYHFKVLFKILNLLNYPFSKHLQHLSYGMVTLPEGKMKSREGTIVDADNLIEKVQNLVKKEIEKREKLSKKEIEFRSLKISLAAIKYFLLKVDYSKEILFNPEESINFEGNTGPYLQYSYARANSILKKSKIKKPALNIINLTEQENKLIKKLSQFQEAVESAYSHLNPSLTANYSFELAQVFNEFYHACPVINSEQENFRLNLVQAFKKIIKQSLYLLGIDVLEEM